MRPRRRGGRQSDRCLRRLLGHDATVLVVVALLEHILPVIPARRGAVRATTS